MAVFNRFFLAFCSLLFISVCSFAQTELSRDQKALLKEALRIAVTDKNFLPEYPELKSQKENTVILYNKMVSLEEPEKEPFYLTEKQVPKLPTVQFDLKSQSEIFGPGRRQDLMFLRVMQIAQPEGDFGIVTVLTQIALGSESREKGFLHKQSTGKTMLFRRTKKGWKFEKVVNTLPNLVDYKLPY